MIVNAGVVQSIDVNVVDVASCWLWSTADIYSQDYAQVLVQPISLEANDLSELKFLELDTILTIRRGPTTTSPFVWSSTVYTVQDPYEMAGTGSPSTGTVTNVGLTPPALMTVTGSPVTDTGTLVMEWSGTGDDIVLADGTTLPTGTYMLAGQMITVSGDVTGYGTASSVATTIASSVVTGKLLTGYVVGSNAAIAATDTVLGAFGKVQGQLNSKITLTSLSATSPILYNNSTGIFSHAATDGNLHVPATGTTNAGKVLTAGAAAGSLSWTTPATGTVTSVALSAPSLFTVTGSPVTGTGTLAFAFNGASTNLVRADGSVVAASSFVSTTDLAGYLPLSAGSGKSLTGTLYGTGLNFTSTADSPILITHNLAGAYTHPLQAFNSGMVAGNQYNFDFGQAASNYNSGNFGFKYVGAGSTSNYVTLGLYGANDLLKITGTGVASFSGSVVTPALTLSGFSTGTLINTSGVVSSLSGTGIVLGNGTTIPQSTFTSGSGTSGVIAKWIGAYSLNNSILTENSGYAGINNAAASWPAYSITETSQGTDAKNWAIRSTSSSFVVDAFNDAWTSANRAVSITRTGYVVGNISLQSSSVNLTALTTSGFVKTNASGLLSVDTNTYLLSGGTAVNSSALGGVNSAYFVQGNGAGPYGHRTTNVSSFNALLPSGFYDNINGISPLTTGWTHMIRSAHSDPSSTATTWSFDLAANFYTAASGNEGYYVRVNEGSNWGTWRTLWHSGNLNPAAIGAAPAFTSSSAGQVWATPAASSGVPGLRMLVASDIPALNYAPPHSLGSRVVLRSNGSGGFAASQITDAGSGSITLANNAIFNALAGSQINLIFRNTTAAWTSFYVQATEAGFRDYNDDGSANSYPIYWTRGTGGLIRLSRPVNFLSNIQVGGTEIVTSSRAITNIQDLTISKAASDAIGVGSFLQLADAASGQTKGWALQLGASNTLDLWNYASSAWTKRASISSAGIPTFSGLAASTLRMATVDASGTLGATSWAYDGPWLSTAGGTLSGSLGLTGSASVAVQALVGLSTRVATINSSGQLGVTSYDANGPWLPQAGGAVTGMLQADGGIRLPHLRVTGNTTLSGPGIVSVNATCTVTLPTPSVSNLGWVIWINSTGAYTVTINTTSGTIIGYTPGISTSPGRQMFQGVMTGASSYAWLCN